MKVRDTVRNHLKNPEMKRRHEDVLVACAMELGDSVSMEVIAATRAISSTDLDAEHEIDAAILWLHEAELNFLAAHRNTEVEL
jgi:hypothetical protein